MWRGHPFSKRNKATERAVEVGAECNLEFLGNVWNHLKKALLVKVYPEIS